MIETFILVHDLDSVTDAAKAMGCCQGAVTMRLKELGKIVPSSVFMTGKGNYALTEFGSKFMEASRKVHAAYNELRQTT